MITCNVKTSVTHTCKVVKPIISVFSNGIIKTVHF
jgi:hypothetical protein